MKHHKSYQLFDSGCGSDAPDASGFIVRIQSLANFIYYQMYWKDKNRSKRGWKWSNENYSSQSLGSVGTAVAFDTRDMQFNSSHW